MEMPYESLNSVIEVSSPVKFPVISIPPHTVLAKTESVITQPEHSSRSKQLAWENVIIVKPLSVRLLTRSKCTAGDK